ncbi:MAG TPA: hypothetical protein VM841_01180 [Actinomycetota bacterium]|nr:hypothetical protein [Actinomycetota bacterium]
MTADPSTGLPVLVVAYCPGERVVGVTLREFDADSYAPGRPMWQVWAIGDGRQLPRIAVGETPAGFRETVALDLPSPVELLELTATFDDDSEDGVVFTIAELKPGILLRYGEPTDERELHKDADAACSLNPLTGFGLPGWLFVVFAAGSIASLVVIVHDAVRRRRRLSNMNLSAGGYG